MGISARAAEPQPNAGVESERLAEEQAALRRVATLVASGATSATVFAAVVQEVAQVMHLPMVGLYRYDGDGLMTVLAAWSDRPHVFQPGTCWPLDGPTMVTEVYRTGRPVRIEDYTDVPGTIAAAARESRLNATAGAPIVVDGAVWGAMGASSPDGPLPDQVEYRLGEFTELVAAAIANSQARDELTRLADEQAALRRVATLAAKGAGPSEVVEAVSVEVARLIGADAAGVTRFDGDGMFTVLGGWTSKDGLELIGRTFPLEGSLSGLVFETRQPARIDTFEHRDGDAAAATRELGWRSAAGAPIFVEDRLWGVLVVHSKQAESFPVRTETRLAEFTEIVASAIASTQNREAITRLAEEQASLRRVATLVAQEPSSDQLFASVAEEVARVMNVAYVNVVRYNPDGSATQMAGWGMNHVRARAGAHWPLDGPSVLASILESGRPARIDDYSQLSGTVADAIRRMGAYSSVGSPIVVAGRVWGAIVVAAAGVEPFPHGTEARLADFTELVGTAIANAESRDQLTASRARVVAASDETRRQIERDLHDGAQQRLVSLTLELCAATLTVPAELSELRMQLTEVADGLTQMLEELRWLIRGIHPGILTASGLGPALRVLVRRSPVRVELDLRCEQRFPEPVEVAAYYVVAEAWTNAAKHAHASIVRIVLDADEQCLRLSICDDGVGGADPAEGSGLLGLGDRVQALGGTIELHSPIGDGTTLLVTIPIREKADLPSSAARNGSNALVA